MNWGQKKIGVRESADQIGQWLKSVVTGHFRYYGVPGNYDAMSIFRFQIGQRGIIAFDEEGSKDL
jgi:RNA-directed DNA polymerase